MFYIPVDVGHTIDFAGQLSIVFFFRWNRNVTSTPSLANTQSIPGRELNTEQCFLLANLWKIGSKKQSCWSEKEQKEEKWEAVILLPTHQGLTSAKEIQPKQIRRLRKKRTGYTLQYRLIFMCFCQEGHKPEKFQTVTQDRGVLKVNLSPSILRGSIVLSCCCNFMDFWNTSPQPLFWGGNQLNEEVRWALQLDY